MNLIACSKKTPVDYAIFTGKIDNVNSKEITLTKSDRSFSKEIAIAANGTFTDTLKTKTGLFTLNVDKNRTSVYLENGSLVNITADAKDFKRSLNFSGKGAEINNYIQYKNKKTAALKGSNKAFYTLEEDEFKNKTKDINTILNGVIDTVKGIEPAFKILEKRNLNYKYLLELLRYANGYHGRWAKKPDYIPSDRFLEEFNSLNINNEEDFILSDVYKRLIIEYYVVKIRELSEKDSIDYYLAKVKVHATIPNETIKNELIFSGAEYGMVKTESFEDYYPVFINASTNEENNAKITTVYNQLKSINEGQPSPKFTDYENNAGGTLSLDDLKGKYTYIDVWATWCGPCIKEIPDLKRIEKEYHGKNINFLSISIDASKDYDKWKKMIVDKELGGIQLMADKAAQSKFLKDYFITSIPRFILIDPDGKIVDKHAPRPSSSELIELFNELNI